MKRWKQILSLLLCLCMLVSYFPDLAVHSHAEEEETAPTIEVETEITEPEESEEPEESISEEPEEVVPEENEEEIPEESEPEELNDDLYGEVSAYLSPMFSGDATTFATLGTPIYGKNYNTNVTLTGNAIDDFVAVAQAQVGKTGSQLSLSGWCTKFISDCARMAGIPTSVIPNFTTAGVGNITNLGGTIVTTPQKGDIVFYQCTKDHYWKHAAIMTGSTNSIQGNVNNQVMSISYKSYLDDNYTSLTDACWEVTFVRPNWCTTHTWDSGKVTKAASCKETGVMTYTCTVCGGTKTETIDKTTNHSWGSWTKVDGTNHKRTCSVCSAAESAVHNYSYVEDPKPTFTTTGTITGTCGACRNVITDTFPVISEKDYVRSIFKEPTYTEQGEERWTWKNTAYGDRHFHFPIPKLVPVSKITLNYTEKTLCKDQEFTLSATVTPSDAANTGVHWKTSNANVATRNYNTQLVHANGVGTAVFTAEADDYQGAVATCTVRVVDHAYTYVVTTAPTTSAAGTLTGTCSGCNGTTTVTLPKLDTTNYTYSVVKAPSPTAEGTGRYTWKTTTYGTFYFDVVLEKTGISGTCGTNLTWTLTNTGVLTISGTGEMENYVTITLLGGKRAPWYDNRADITSVVIENGVTSIGNYAFNGCSSLSGVTIAASVTGIGGNAFAGCTALRSIEIPANVSSIAATAFANCSALTAIQVNANNKTYTSVDGILFTKDKTTLVRYPLGKTGAYRIPDSVTAVGNYAFSGCTGLTDITIPNSVVSIGSNAFSGCSALNHVYFDGIQKEWDAIEKDSAGLPENIEVEYIHVHNFTYVVAKEPGTALFATGRLTGTCSGCSEEKSVVLPRLTATDYNYSVIKETTCLADGTGRYTWKTTTYGTFYFDVTIPGTGHSFTYKVTKTPTTSATGTLTGTCSKCSSTITETLPKLDTTNYTYSEIQAATETATGIGRYTWKNTYYGTFTFDVVIPKLEPQTQRGDLNGDGKVTDLDVSALLRHILFPARYEIIGDADFNKDGKLTDADAGYLLKHTLFPTRYPL